MTGIACRLWRDWTWDTAPEIYGGVRHGQLQPLGAIIAVWMVRRAVPAA